MAKIQLKTILICIGLFKIVHSIVIITPPDVGDTDLRDLAVSDEADTNYSLPYEAESNSDAIPLDDDDQEPKRKLFAEGSEANDQEKQKIEITPKATEISYEVKVTNMLKTDGDSLSNSSKQGNLRSLVVDALAEKQKDTRKTPLVDVKSEESIKKPTTEPTTEPVDPAQINIIEPEEIDQIESERDDDEPESKFEENPPIDVVADHKLEFGLINVFPLTKLYSVYLLKEVNHKDFFDLPPNTTRDEVLVHPYNGKIVEILNPLLNQVRFNHQHIQKMDDTLVGLEHAITSLSKNVKFTPSNHKLLEEYTVKAKKTQEIWRNSCDYTKNKLIATEESLNKVKQCIVANPMDKCQKHFETVFDLLNLLDIFSPNGTLCKYSSICKINLGKKVVEFLHFTQVKRDFEAASRDIEKIIKFAYKLRNENHKAAKVDIKGIKPPIIRKARADTPKAPNGAAIAKHSTPITNHTTRPKQAEISKLSAAKLARAHNNLANLHTLTSFCAFLVMVFAIGF